MLAKSIPLQQECTALDVIRIILAILLPPLGVFLQVGIGLHFWLNILLTLLGYIPGIVHAIWSIARRWRRPRAMMRRSPARKTVGGGTKDAVRESRGGRGNK